MLEIRNKPNVSLPKKSPSKVSEGSKLLESEHGTTLEQLLELTGWQEDTVGSALTSLKNKCLSAERSPDGGSRYTLARELGQ